jgi:flagellar basal body rod protein FlgG
VSEFGILRTAAAGMDAQRSALDLAARNVAAAEADGVAFERLVPRFAVAPAPSDPSDPDAYEPPQEGTDPLGTALDAADSTEAADLPIRYLGATAQRGSEVDAVTEMVAVLEAQRAYESNASVFDLGKRLAERTIDLGRI